MNAIYHLPDFTSSKGFLGKVENGWWASGIYSLQSGYPMNAFLGSNRSANGDNDRHKYFLIAPTSSPAGSIATSRTGSAAGCGTGATRAAGGGAIAAGTPLGTPTLWYDPCAFSIQPQGFLGMKDGIICGVPALTILNFSLVKDTAVGFLGESGKVEFRAEFFNIFNHPNFRIAHQGCDHRFMPARARRLDCGLRASRREPRRCRGNDHRDQWNCAPDSVWTEDFVLMPGAFWRNHNASHGLSAESVYAHQLTDAV